LAKDVFLIIAHHRLQRLNHSVHGLLALFAFNYDTSGIASAGVGIRNTQMSTTRSTTVSADESSITLQSNVPDILDTRGFDALRMAISYVLLQMVLSREELLLILVRADGARVTLMLVRSAMPNEGVSPCIHFSAKWFRAFPRFMWDALGMLVQFLKVLEQPVALLANVALLVFVRVFHLDRRN
jgi:hypothetical protein